MNKKITPTHFAMAIVLGSVWGFGEVALGVGLKACAHLMSGSLMTGVALFFIAASWSATRNILIPLIVVLTASLLKLFDAALLSLPVMSGAIGNPIFAFILEGLAFILLILVFRQISWEKRKSGALLGAGTALIAVAAFPLVKYATGVPACVYPNTAIPTSIFFSPIAIAISAITVPLGLRAGIWFAGWYSETGARIRSAFLRALLSPATAGVCILLIVVFRLIVV
jgi:hypothetical protein